MKSIARNPSITKNLDFTVPINKNGLMMMPPIGRFKFLVYYFNYAIAPLSSFRSDKHYVRSLYSKKRINGRHRSVNVIASQDEIKESLFPVITKSKKCLIWISAFDEYKKLETMPKLEEGNG